MLCFVLLMLKPRGDCIVIRISWIKPTKDLMLYSPSVSAVIKWNQADEHKKWLVFTYIKPYLQAKDKLINPKLD